MSNIKHDIKIDERGFTLIELLLVIAIAGILFGITTFNLAKTQRSTSVATSEEMLIADLRSQQVKAMNGTDNGGSFGIHFSSNNTYTLFQGTNFTGVGLPVTVDDNISFTGSDIVFSSINGEVKDFSAAIPPTVVVADTVGTGQKTIILNRYGVVIQD